MQKNSDGLKQQFGSLEVYRFYINKQLKTQQCRHDCSSKFFDNPNGKEDCYSQCSYEMRNNAIDIYNKFYKGQIGNRNEYKTIPVLKF